MPQLPDADLGFDPKVARTNLTKLLVELGTVSREQIAEWTVACRPVDIDAARQQLKEHNVASLKTNGQIVHSETRIEEMIQYWKTENQRRASRTDEDVEWLVAADAAQVHALLHATPVIVNGVPHPRCEQWPCRACGASYALWELCILMSEQPAPATNIANELAEIVRLLRRIEPRVADVQVALAVQKQRHDELATKVLVAEAPWDDGWAVLSMFAPLVELVDGLSVRARGELMSNELRRARPGTRGRPKNWGLTALWQHLERGGFSQREIADCVPDNNSVRDDEARIDRVHNRLAEAECRSILPYVPDEESVGA